MTKRVTVERVRELLNYDPETGVFTWRIAPHPRLRAGAVAGSYKTRGYRQIMLDWRHYTSHRLAWLHFYGKWPEGQIDHIDGDPANNRIANLRDVSPSHNAQNQRRAMSTSKTGFLGVHPMAGRFAASIRVNGKKIYLGLSSTPEEAHEKYLQAKRQFHEGNTL